MSSSMLPPTTWCGGVLALGLTGDFHIVRPADEFGEEHAEVKCCLLRLLSG